jgi:radical SAM protein with 4Fe4S-binding SPASM domain
MKMLPCSFDNQKQRWAVDLRKYSIKEAWDSDVFENFRNHFKSACPDCSKRRVCMGGCPITPEVVLCRNAAVLAQ